MKTLLLVSIFSFLTINYTFGQCKNLTFQEIYSLWILYNNKTIESNLLAKGADKIEENIYGICYSLLPESKSDSIYSYNEIFQTSQALRFTYGTFNKEAFIELKNYVSGTYQFIGSYSEAGIKYRVYYHPTYKYSCLSESNSGLSQNRTLFLYGLEFDNLKPPYFLQPD